MFFRPTQRVALGYYIIAPSGLSSSDNSSDNTVNPTLKRMVPVRPMLFILAILLP
jgi:hypothetical protein